MDQQPVHADRMTKADRDGGQEDKDGKGAPVKVSGPPMMAIKVMAVIQIDFAGIQTTLPFTGSLLLSIIRPVEILLMTNSSPSGAFST